MPDKTLGVSSPARVLCTNIVSFGGGVLRVIQDGMPALSQFHEIRVTVADLYGRSELFDPGTIEVDSSIGVPGRGYISTNKGLRRWIDMFFQLARHARIVLRLSAALTRYDILFVHHYKELVLAIPAIWLRRSSIALVWHCHGLGDGAPPRFLRQLTNRCHRINAISNSVQDRLVEIGIDRRKIATVYDAINLCSIKEADAWRPEEQPPSDPGRLVILVATSTMYSSKGIHLVVEALATLPDSCVLWITGDDASGFNREYVEELKALSWRLCIADRVKFLGFRPDIYSVMKAANVICVPSLVPEGFGLVAAEAMALGKVVVVSNRGALPEVVDHGRAGLVFDPDVPGDLAEKLNLVFNNPTRIAALAADAASYAAKAYSYTRWAEEVKKGFLIALQSNSADCTQ
jgi:glycosyltransferase involved in cell wall biosynthesis